MRPGEAYIEGILPKGPYLPCVSMAGRALLAGYHRYASVNWIIIRLGNGLSPVRCHVNVDILNKFQWTSNTNTTIFIQRMYLKMSSANSRPFLFQPLCVYMYISVYAKSNTPARKHDTLHKSMTDMAKQPFFHDTINSTGLVSFSWWSLDMDKLTS